MWRPSISNCVWSTLLLAIFVQQTLAQRTPTISYITQEQIKDIGGTVEFDCSVQYAKEYNVLFLKTDSDPVFLSTGSTLVIKDSRFSLRYDPNSSTYKLQIKDIQETDAGTYTCQVEFAPVITVPRPRLGQALQYDMYLECHIEAYPPPAIVWTKDDIQLANNQHYSISHFATADEYTDSTLRVITVEKRQYGDYVCKATNRFGEAEARVNLFETIIPVCPPACGQAYIAGAEDVSATSFALVGILAALLFAR
nr:RH65858p [Drosophila melanogaster]